MSTATIDLSTLQAAKVVDARAMACPGPLLEAKNTVINLPSKTTRGPLR